MDKVERKIENTDLSNCDREPIHIPGQIQCHGFLVGLDSDLNITHCSANINGFLPVRINQILGKPLAALEDLLQTPDNEVLISRLIKTSITEKGFEPLNPYHLYIKQEYYNLIISRSGEFYILEFEPSYTDTGRDLLQLIGSSISAMLADSDLGKILQYAACQIKKIIGYDRIMIYKFHEDGHGEVIAEEKNAELIPFLGLHYPASDIPKQARDLYKINLTRLISNVNDTPSSIVSAPGKDFHPLDLTNVGLRAVSPIHIQYLTNMGVMSSFSISLIDKNQLWGLVACHHYTPRFINYKERGATKLIGQVLSSALGFRKNKEDEKKKNLLKQKVDELAHHLIRDDSLKESLISHSTTILDAVEAGGAAMVYEKEVHSVGNTPPSSFILRLVDWLQNSNEHGLFYTDRLVELFPEVLPFNDSGSGILSCRINRELEEYIIWFRPEMVSLIQWAGNPEKPVEVNPASDLQISPRTSFKVWSETVRGTSLPWKMEDIESAKRLREEIIFTINRRASELRLLNEKLKAANDELTAFSHTISHDLRNPLSSINGFAQLILMDENISPEDLKFIMERIFANTTKMDLMIKEILKYSQAGSQPITRKQIDVKAILEEIKQEMIIGTPHPAPVIDIGPTPALNGDHTMLTQIFSNVIGNAVKYSSRSSSPKVTIEGKKADAGVQYIIRDNGIGIKPNEIDRIFDLFIRLDTGSQFDGSGVGLAIVKKLVGKHEGEIRVESEPGKGTVFYLLFRN